MRMADDPDVELAIAVRGGYGWSRLLDRLDFAAIARSGTRWLGHSDFTAFQLAALAHAGLVTFAGPMAAYDFGAATPSAFTLEHCWRMLDRGARRRRTARWTGPTSRARARCGAATWRWSRTSPARRICRAIDDGILFLEDIGEHPYRIERMLHQLRFAGILERQRAVRARHVQRLRGDAQRQRLRFRRDARPPARAMSRSRSITGLPFGHCPRQADAAGRRPLRTDGPRGHRRNRAVRLRRRGR